jgi:hypothetical protein
LETEKEGIKAAEQRKAATEENDKKFLEYATARNKQALAEINGLNPDDPEFTDKAAQCWARANLEIRRWEPAAAATPPGAAPAGEFAPRSSEEKPDGKAADDEPATDAILTTKSFIESVLEGASLGIPKDDPLFWTFAEKSPAVNADGTPIPLKDQIWWAVDRTLTYRRGAAMPAAPAAPVNSPVIPSTGSPPAPPAGPGAAMPMGRSGAFRPAGGGPASSGPVSLAETLDSVMEMRRL